MSQPAQVVLPGCLQSAYRREFWSLVEGDAIRRLWAKDVSLWPAEDHRTQLLKNYLSWLDLPEKIGPYLARVAEAAASAEAEGIQDWVIVGMDGSNLAAETVLRLSLVRPGNRLFVLDTADPAAVRGIEEALQLHRTLFILVSKSGKHIETHALFLYFLDRMKAAGIAAPGHQFVALTEEGSYLAHLAKEYHFREVFYDPPGISGRYSALIHFGLLLSSLCRFDTATLLSRVAAMRDACGPSAPCETNPALTLAAFLAAGAVEGRDRLVLLSGASLVPLTNRIAQLVGISTGKGGQGIVPVFGDVPPSMEVLQRESLVAIFTSGGDADPGLKDAEQQLQQAGVPVVHIELNGPENLGAEMLKWELATVLTCALLDVDPFYEPDFQDGRESALRVLDSITKKQELAKPTVRVRETGIELFAENVTRQEISTLSLSDALRTFFDLRNPDGYLAILTFVDDNTATEAALRRMREQLASWLGIPVLLVFGPRYLHCLGQLFKGGPAKGLFLMLTGEPAQDVAIPGAGYSFGQLQMALACGDFEAMGQREKYALRLQMTQGAEQGLAQLERLLGRALAASRRAAR